MSTERDPETDQPLPTNDHPNLPVIHELVCDDLQDRLAMGIRKYGTALRPWNNRSFLLDALGEVYDLAVYLRGLLYEEEHPHPTPGLLQVRDRLAESLVTAAYPDTAVEVAITEHLVAGPHGERSYWLNLAEIALESHPWRTAVDTLRREAMEKGASPGLSALLSELQDAPAGLTDDDVDRMKDSSTDFALGLDTGYQRGLERAVELIAADMAQSSARAYEAGLRTGREMGRRTD